METVMILLLIGIIFVLVGFIQDIEIEKRMDDIIEYYPEHSFLLLLNLIKSIKILFISNRDVDANIFLTNIKEINFSEFSFAQRKILLDEILNLKTLLISLNRYRSIQSENIEFLLDRLNEKK